MITLSQIKWGGYRGYEGPFFGGVVKVLEVPRSAPFAHRVLSLTAAAEGGHYDAINMYDSGLVSVGAIQFIDVNTFQVTDMLGAVAEELGVEYVRNALKPALDLCNAEFSKTDTGIWRFSLSGVVVNTKDLQKKLYYGDLTGNKVGSFNNAKRIRAKTWAACLANVWIDPRAVTVQSRFTLPRLVSGFVWNELKKDLFTGEQPEDGWVGALRAILLSYAVNLPAVVVNRYSKFRVNNKPFKSPEWCLAVLRDVIGAAGVDVWPARWAAKKTFAKNMFGVTLPSWNQLVSGTWSAPQPVDPAPLPTPEPIAEPEPEPEPIPQPVIDLIPLPAPEPAPVPEPLPMPVVQPQGAFTVLIQLVKMMLEIISSIFRKR